jgi:hypothetical protein
MESFSFLIEESFTISTVQEFPAVGSFRATPLFLATLSAFVAHSLSSGMSAEAIDGGIMNGNLPLRSTRAMFHHFGTLLSVGFGRSVSLPPS